ncbi:YecA family protein [soil metagenome]
MAKLSSKLRKLDAALLDLASDEAMGLSEFDGFCAGLLVCPDLVMPGEWLKRVWGEEEDGEPVFDDLADARKMIAMLTDHYNDVAKMLHRRQGDYAAIYDVDTRNGETLWEIWVEGFAAAMELRPESWTAMARDFDEDTAAAFSCLVVLIDIARGESDLPAETIEEMTVNAHDLIPGLVETLYDAQLRLNQGALAAPAAGPVTRGKTGRNEPCPCGSGKKYKKCCGLN